PTKRAREGQALVRGRRGSMARRNGWRTYGPSRATCRTQRSAGVTPGARRRGTDANSASGLTGLDAARGEGDRAAMRKALRPVRLAWRTWGAVVCAVVMQGCTTVLGIDKDYHLRDGGGGAGGGAGGTSSTATTSSGTGGSGGSPCTPVDDQKPCTDDVCENGMPAHHPVASGTVLPVQMAGDCKVAVCDGQGMTSQVA